jgi:orotidine-5'-phosphate decarboxylase
MLGSSLEGVGSYMHNRPIVALDFASWEETEDFVNQFSEPLFVKVGMELYLQNGPSLIYSLKSKGHSIFLDLKLHDIPNTVYQTMKGLARLEIDMINVHAAGGSKMMERALEGLADGAGANQRPKLLAVTQLTSTSEANMQDNQLIEVSLIESVLHYASIASRAGLDGVVCSPLEAGLVRERCGPSFLTITPGIRQSQLVGDDQERVTTPKMAKELGSSGIVVGRPITKASNPIEAYREIMREWKGC